jgi:phosphoserine phosphatase
MFIATLIAKDRLSGGDISAACDALAAAGTAPRGRSWIEADKACDLLFPGPPAPARAALEGLLEGVDVVVQGEASRRRRLLVADMDSTMISVECIDELADFAGRKAEVAAVTERAMLGEIGFEAALAERVALLSGLEEAAIDRCRAQRVRLTPGARALVRTMKREGAWTILVSGGFTRFADPVGEEIGFDRVVANRLDVVAGRLTGSVLAPVLGAEGKRLALLESAAERRLRLEETLAVGDGANDVPMLKEAGLGIAYHAKPAAAAAADAAIVHNDLTALLYAQGWARAEWEAD